MSRLTPLRESYHLVLMLVFNSTLQTTEAMKTNYISLSLGVLLLLASCNQRFIELAPQSSLTDANFFKTETDFRQALNGAYEPIRSGITGRTSWMMGELRADNTHYEQAIAGAFIEGSIAIANFIDDAANPNSNDKYFQLYTGVARTNAIISRISGAGLKPEVETELVGQAKFLRALYYFDLVQYYGGVSLYKNEITNTADAYLPRASKEDVYALIQADAQDAIAKLANPTFPQTGRATKGAAKMLLAKLYMVKKEYANAEKELKDIVAMGYSLQPNYADAFNPATKNSRESIFEAQFQAGNQGQQSDFVYYFLPSSVNLKAITGVSASNGAFNSLSGGWNIPTPEMIAAYEKGDKRLDASIGVAEGTGLVGSFEPEKLVSIVDYKAPAGKIGKPFVKKYLSNHTIPFNTDNNWPIYRYADALLLLAEALTEQNKASEALPLLNQVRSRAGLAASTQTAQATLRDAIARERRVELAFENHRWLDLVRTGKAIEVMTANGAYMKSLYPSLLPTTYAVTANRLVFPIPAREIQINSQLTQNPGY